MKKSVCIATTTRADWGLLRPVAQQLRACGIPLYIVAANMHLDERFGATVSEIEADGFKIDYRIKPEDHPDTPAGRALAMADFLAGFARAFEVLDPGALVALGDRYEMLAAAEAAVTMGIPVIHIAGGEISEGALDDSYRHAITKLSALHFTATEPYRHRVIQMGETPETVICSGALGVVNFKTMSPLPLNEISEFVGLPLREKGFAVVTYHPATLAHGTDHNALTVNLLDALDKFPELQLIITAPNSDAGGAGVIPLLQRYAADNPGRVAYVPSLGARRYLSTLHYAAAVIGNSSSGIVEVPSAGIPTVDIGIRQRGRIAAPSVIHCDTDSYSIYNAVEKALSPEFSQFCAGVSNPYDCGDAPAIIADGIERFLNSPVEPKKFHDL